MKCHIPTVPAETDTRLGIGLRHAGKGKELCHHVAPIFGVLAKALVKFSPHPTSNVGYDAVQHFPALFVLIEIVIDVRA